MAQVYPSGMTLAVLSFITIPLDIPPLLNHVSHSNIPATALVGWVILLNVFSIVNASLWPNDSTSPWYDGAIWCDVQVKLQIGSWVALPACVLCMFASLCRIMDTNNVTLSRSRAQQMRTSIFELGLCVGFPILDMALHYVVQPSRYFIWSIAGCNPSLDSSWVSIVLIFMWPLVLAVIASGFAVLLLYRIWRYRASLSSFLHIRNTTRGRFYRLLAMSLTLLVIFLPLESYVLYLNVNLPLHAYSWSNVHDSAFWNEIMYIPTQGEVRFDCWIRVVCGMLVFAFFGWGRDVQAMYIKWLQALGLHRVAKTLARLREKQRAYWSSSSFARRGTSTSNRTTLLPRWSTKAFSGITADKFAKKTSWSVTESSVEMDSPSRSTTLNDSVTLTSDGALSPGFSPLELKYSSPNTLPRLTMSFEDGFDVSKYATNGACGAVDQISTVPKQ